MPGRPPLLPPFFSRRVCLRRTAAGPYPRPSRRASSAPAGTRVPENARARMACRIVPVFARAAADPASIRPERVNGLPGVVVPPGLAPGSAPGPGRGDHLHHRFISREAVPTWGSNGERGVSRRLPAGVPGFPLSSSACPLHRHTRPHEERSLVVPGYLLQGDCPETRNFSEWRPLRPGSCSPAATWHSALQNRTLPRASSCFGENSCPQCSQ